MKQRNSEGKRWICFGLVMLLGAVGARAQVSSYHVPKEKAVVIPEPAAGEATAKPLEWVTPSGWKELPGDSMRVATFTIMRNGRQAQATIVPIGGRAGTMQDNVNRWRSQLGQGPLEPAAISNQIAAVEIGGSQGQLYEVAGSLPDGDKNRPARLVVAVLLRDDTAWFFKLIGDDALVAGQKVAFVQFLKSISFNNNVVAIRHELPAPVANAGGDFASIHQGMKLPGLNMGGDLAPQPVSESSIHPDWQVPAGWKAIPASPMLVAKFQATGVGSAKADINISAGPVLGGGAGPNINRWRGQLGLGPVDGAGLEKLISQEEVAGVKALLVDMSGSDPESGDTKRVVALIVPFPEQTWFFKLMGDTQVVDAQKAALLTFVHSVKFGHEH